MSRKFASTPGAAGGRLKRLQQPEPEIASFSAVKVSAPAPTVAALTTPTFVDGPSTSFISSIGGVSVRVTLTEQSAGAHTRVRVTLEVLDGGDPGDLRGFFFDIGDNSKLAGMTATGADVTDSEFDGSVSDLGNGANMNGGGQRVFEGGVEIGTQGIGRDDIRTTTFTLSNTAKNLKLADFADQNIGIRLTSTGDDREGSLKITDTVDLTAGLGDYVWLDADGDGRQDADEAGVAGAKVNLHDGATGTVIASTVTAADGSYSFTGLAAGGYYVTFEAPEGFAFTPPDIGDDAADSDAVLPDPFDPTLGRSQTVTLAAGEFNPTLDAGLIAQPAATEGVITGRIFCDKDGTQTETSADTPVVGRTVILHGAGADGVFGTADDVTRTTTTDADGVYVFDLLEPGDYTVEFEVQGLVAQDVGSDDAIDSDANPATGVTGVVTLPDSGGSVRIENLDAGVICHDLSDTGLLGITGARDLSAPRLLIANDQLVGMSYDAASDLLVVNAGIMMTVGTAPLGQGARIEIRLQVGADGAPVPGGVADVFVWADDGDGRREAGEEVFLEGDVVKFGWDGSTLRTFQTDFAFLTTGGTRQADFPDLAGAHLFGEWMGAGATAPDDFSEDFWTASVKGSGLFNLAYECLC